MSQIEITFIQPDGEEKTVTVEPGFTLMEAALFNGVDGIQGLCGGVCSCATCHIALDADVLAKIAEATDGEAEMLELLDDHVATSRLGCQISASETLNGARIRIIGTLA